MTAIQAIDTIQQRIQHRVDIDLLHERADEIADLLERGKRLRGDRRLEESIASYLSEQAERRDRDERGPLCSCRLPTCSVKRGIVPPPIRIRGSGTLRPIETRRRAAEWTLDHAGDAAAIQEALVEFDAEIGRLYAEWLTLYQEIKHQQWQDRVGSEDPDT